MNASIPPRFSLSHLSPARILLVFSTGLAPSVLILLSSLPFWVRAWLWIPVLGLSLAMAFGRVEGRSVIGLLSSAWSFARRKRKHVWALQRDEEQEEIVVETPAGQPRPLRRLLEGAMVYGVVTSVILGIALVLAIGIRWALFRMFAPPDAIDPVYATQDELTSSPDLSLSPPPTAVPALTSPSLPTASPTPTPTPTPDPTASVYEGQWEILALPGSLKLGNANSSPCSLYLSIPAGEYSFSIPGSETVKLLVIPLLQPQTMGRTLTVRSSCALDVELVPFRPWHPQYARVWLIPVCDPPGRVRMRPHGGDATMTMLDLDGNSQNPPVNVPLAGTWAPQPPVGSCRLYRVESNTPIWLDVMVFATP